MDVMFSPLQANGMQPLSTYVSCISFRGSEKRSPRSIVGENHPAHKTFRHSASVVYYEPVHPLFQLFIACPASLELDKVIQYLSPL